MIDTKVIMAYYIALGITNGKAWFDGDLMNSYINFLTRTIGKDCSKEELLKVITDDLINDKS